MCSSKAISSFLRERYCSSASFVVTTAISSGVCMRMVYRKRVISSRAKESLPPFWKCMVHLLQSERNKESFDGQNTKKGVEGVLHHHLSDRSWIFYHGTDGPSL